MDNIDKNIKYHFLLNGIKYKEYNKYESIIYSINLINIIFVYVNILFVTKVIKNNNLNEILSSLFIFSDIYILVYSNKVRFKKNISRNFNLVITQYYKTLSKYIFIINILLCFLISFLSLYFNYTFKFVYYRYRAYISFCFLFYSFNIKLNILSLFFITKANLVKLFNDYLSRIKADNININKLLIHYLEIRHIYNKTINNYNFVISNILSFYYLPVLYLVTNYKFDYFFQLNSIIYIIFLFLFQKYIEDIDSNITYIKSNIDKSNNLKNYIIRKDFNYNLKNNNIDLIDQNELNIKKYILDIENSHVIDYQLLSIVINQNLKCFDLFGLEFDNGSIIYKLVNLSIILILGKKIIM